MLCVLYRAAGWRVGQRRKKIILFAEAGVLLMILLGDCPICHSRRIYKWGEKRLEKRQIPVNLIDAEDQYLLSRLAKNHLTRSVYFCFSCRFLFQNPTYSREELKKIYDRNGTSILNFYEAAGTSAHELWHSPTAYKNREKRKDYYARVINGLNGSTILDYGGGSGINLSHDGLKNKKRYVYDFGRIGNDYEEGIIAIQDLQCENYFDFILCTHTLEHDPDPLRIVRLFRKLIKPNGYLFIEVPFELPERTFSRRPGAVWHVNYFSRKSILEIADRSTWCCKSIDLRYLPYSKDYVNCLVAILMPMQKGMKKNTCVSETKVFPDFVHALSNRLRNQPSKFATTR